MRDHRGRGVNGPGVNHGVRGGSVAAFIGGGDAIGAGDRDPVGGGRHRNIRADQGAEVRRRHLRGHAGRRRQVGRIAAQVTAGGHVGDHRGGRVNRPRINHRVRRRGVAAFIGGRDGERAGDGDAVRGSHDRDVGANQGAKVRGRHLRGDTGGRRQVGRIAAQVTAGGHMRNHRGRRVNRPRINHRLRGGGVARAIGGGDGEGAGDGDAIGGGARRHVGALHNAIIRRHHPGGDRRHGRQIRRVATQVTAGGHGGDHRGSGVNGPSEDQGHRRGGVAALIRGGDGEGAVGGAGGATVHMGDIGACHGAVIGRHDLHGDADIGRQVRRVVTQITAGGRIGDHRRVGVNGPGVNERHRGGSVAAFIGDGHGEGAVRFAGGTAVHMGDIGARHRAVIGRDDLRGHAGIRREIGHAGIATQIGVRRIPGDDRGGRVNRPGVNHGQRGGAVAAPVNGRDGESAVGGAGGAGIHMRHDDGRGAAALGSGHLRSHTGIGRQGGGAGIATQVGVGRRAENDGRGGVVGPTDGLRVSGGVGITIRGGERQVTVFQAAQIGFGFRAGDGQRIAAAGGGEHQVGIHRVLNIGNAAGNGVAAQHQVGRGGGEGDRTIGHFHHEKLNWIGERDPRLGGQHVNRADNVPALRNPGGRIIARIIEQRLNVRRIIGGIRR